MKQMKIEVKKPKGLSDLEAEEQLEKALKAKSKALEAKYAKESYQDARFDAFHDHVMELFQKVIKDTVKDLETTIKFHLKG